MFKVSLYIFSGLILGIAVSTIFLKSSTLRISDESTLWSIVNSCILLATAVIVIIYTHETYLLRKHTSLSERPLLSLYTEYVNQDGESVINKFHGYSEEYKPTFELNLYNYGGEKAIITDVEILNYYLPIKHRSVSLKEYNQLVSVDSESRIHLEYNGPYTEYPNIDEYSKDNKVRMGGIGVLHGVEPKKFEESKKIIASPEDIKFRVKVTYKNLAGTKFNYEIKIKDEKFVSK